MPRRNTVKLKRPSKQLLRRRRNRLKRRRDKASARRHQPKPSTIARKKNAELALSIGEERVQLAIRTQDPAYIAAAKQLYENIESIPMETLLEAAEGNQFHQLGSGLPVKISKDELLDLIRIRKYSELPIQRRTLGFLPFNQKVIGKSMNKSWRILEFVSIWWCKSEEFVELIDDGTGNNPTLLNQAHWMQAIMEAVKHTWKNVY